MDEQRAAEAIKALNKAGAINVGTAEGTPVSREHAKEIVQAIRNQKRDELAVDDIVTRLQEQLDGAIPMVIERQDVRDALDEIERLRKRDAVLELFAKAFHVDEYGQFPVTNGEDVWAAVLAYAQMRVEEARRG